MKLREALAILFCWIFIVLLTYEINQPDTIYIYEKSYTVSQDGVGTDYSLDEFNQVTGPHPDTTYYLSGDFTRTLTINVSGKEDKPVTIDGNNDWDNDTQRSRFVMRDNDKAAINASTAHDLTITNCFFDATEMKREEEK